MTNSDSQLNSPASRESILRAWDLAGFDGIKEVIQHLENEYGASSLYDIPRRQLLTITGLGTFPPLSWLVQGEIPAHALTMLYGASGGGKSFVAIDYALSIARQTGQKVIYLAAEGASGYYDRASAWCRHHKYSGEGILFDIQPLTLRDPQAVQMFIDSIKQVDPVLVIIDTLARCMLGLDENSARDMGLAVEACATIIRETGAAVMLVHHTGKSGIGERGSSALFAACDSVISLSNDDGLITISSSKTKDGQPFADRYLRLVQIVVADGRTSCVVMPSDRVIMRGAALTVTQRKVLETLAQESFVATGAKAAILQSITGASNGALYKALSALMREGYVRQAVKGDPFYIEPKGYEAAQAQNVIPLHSTSSPHGESGMPQTNSTPLHPPYKGGEGGISGESKNRNGAAGETDNPLPHFNALTDPLHSSNGKGGNH